MKQRLHIDTWFAIIITLWLIVTGLVVMIGWLFSPGLGPQPDPAVSRHLIRGLSFWLSIAGWFAIPLLLAPFGLRASDPE